MPPRLKRMLFGLGLLKQQTGTRGSEGQQLQWLLRQKPGVRGVQRGHGERLAVAIKVVLVNCQRIQEGEAGLSSRCFQQGRKTGRRKTFRIS